MIFKIQFLFAVIFIPSTLLFAQGINEYDYKKIITDSFEPNNDSVPEVISTSGQFQRIVVARLKHKTDLKAGLQEVVEQENIDNAVILCGIGSLTSYHLHAVSNSIFPSTNEFYKANEPMDLVSVSGYIINKKVHAHISISNEKHTIGGHLEPGTVVFTFAIITIGVLNEEMDISRFDDKTMR